MGILSKFLIFAVDDDPMFLHAIKKSLNDQAEAIEVETFITGEDCINNIHKQPHLVLLDINFEQTGDYAMSGLEVLLDIKKLSPVTEVVMLSGQDDLEVARDSKKLGAFGYMVKGSNTAKEIPQVISRVRQKIQEQSKQLEKEMKRPKKRIVIAVGMLILALLVYLLMLR